MSIVNTLALESNRQIKINFDGGDLSSDAGLLLIKEFISKLGIDTLLEKAFKTNDPVFKSVLEKDALASQPTVSRFHRLLFWIWIPLFLMHTAGRKAEPLTFTIRAMVIIHLSVMME